MRDAMATQPYDRASTDMATPRKPQAPGHPAGDPECVTLKLRRSDKTVWRGRNCHDAGDLWGTGADGSAAMNSSASVLKRVYCGERERKAFGAQPYSSLKSLLKYGTF